MLPHFRSLDSPEELEEERRLCYVGMTRSKDRLYMLRAFRRRFTRGIGPSGPSRFLYDLPGHLIASPVRQEARTISSWQAWGPSVVTATEPAPDAPSLKTGDKVRHPSFGEGIVISCTPSGHDYEVTVAFGEASGVKRLLLSYAKLDKV